jgi:hypothetical protein
MEAFVSSHATGLQKVGGTKIDCRGCVMETRICHRTSSIPSSKLFKTGKQTKWRKGLPTSWLLFLPMFRKSGGKTFNAVCFKKTLAQSQTIFTPKRSRLLSQDWFLYRDNAAVQATSGQEFKMRQRRKDNPLTSLFTRFCPSGLVCVLESKVGLREGRPNCC